MTRENYRKANQTIVITFLIASIILTMFTASLIGEAYHSGQLYTLTGVVTEVDTELRLTTFTDTNGESWRFAGIKNWTVGDSIKVTVNSNNTKDFHDDKVIGANKIKSFKDGI